MLLFLAPSKTQQTPIIQEDNYTSAKYLEKTREIILSLQSLAIKELSELMKMSEKLALTNHERFQNFSFPHSPENSGQALLVFQGDVYSEIKTETYTTQQFQFAQEHVRILSGLYGMLRPLDLIQPYRLEMGLKWETTSWKSLYEFWREEITSSVNEQCEEINTQEILNLASAEYFNVINKRKLNPTIITPVFKEQTEKGLRTIAIYAKRARGMMAHYIISNQITNINKIKDFTQGGYGFNEELSSTREVVFTRKK